MPEPNGNMALTLEEYLEQGNEIILQKIDPSPLDPCFKCIQGDYTGRYTYLGNCPSDQTETKGFIIGGRQGYDVIENPSKIDILIPDPSLDEKHAHIFCRRDDEFGSQFIV